MWHTLMAPSTATAVFGAALCDAALDELLAMATGLLKNPSVQD
jgi:hypothetical protein